MEFCSANINRQVDGFLKTQNLFRDRSLSPYSNFDISDFKNTSVTVEIQEELKSLLYIGKRVEIFFKTSLEKHQNYELIFHSLQLRDKYKKTLGEIDFLIRDLNTSVIRHIELVFKFYIFDPEHDIDLLKCFMGPKRKDFLFKKLDKLHTHQFPILFSKEAKQAFSQSKINLNKVEQNLCFQAQVFLPFRKDVILPKYINPQSISGYWLKYGDLKKLSRTSQYVIPKRQDWMVQPNFTDFDYKDFSSTEKEIANQVERGLCPMVWEKNKAGIINKYLITLA